MVVCYPQPLQPWSGNREEDRRFRRILLAALVLFSVLTYLVTSWTLPRLEVPSWELELPPRIARLVAERLEPAPSPAPLGRLETPAPAATPTREPAQETAPPAAAASAPSTAPAAEPPAGTGEDSGQTVDRVARAGVLALSDRLARLRSSSPKIAMTGSHPGDVSGANRQSSSQTSRLTEDVTGGSVGIGSDPVASGAVLGTARLPGKRVAGVRPVGAGKGGGTASGDISAERSGSGRSQEEIQEILDRNKRAIYALYNRELRFDPTLRGKVVLAITIAPSGEVTECRIVSSELDAASLEQKLVILIKRIDFGAKPGVPTVRTHVPIEFFPA